MTEVKDAAGVQDNITQPVTEAVVETKKEETIGEALSEKKEPKMVPEAVFLELKKDNKEMAKQMKELQKAIESGATNKEVSTDIKAIADEHNVDPDFLQKFAAAVKAQNEKEIEEKVSSRLKPLEEKEKQAKIDKIFKENYEKTLEAMPEYKDVANEAVIKSLSLDPSNQNKTFAQIVEQAYGHLITGKKTMESSTPRGGKDDNQKLDFDRAAKDSKYFAEVMSNPEMKKEYNESLAQRLKL